MHSQKAAPPHHINTTPTTRRWGEGLPPTTPTISRGILHGRAPVALGAPQPHCIFRTLPPSTTSTPQGMLCDTRSRTGPRPTVLSSVLRGGMGRE